jgi:hypothetical protein
VDNGHELTPSGLRLADTIEFEGLHTVTTLHTVASVRTNITVDGRRSFRGLRTFSNTPAHAENEMVTTLSQWTREGLRLDGQRDEAGTSTSTLDQCYSPPEPSIVLHYRTLTRSPRRPRNLKLFKCPATCCPACSAFASPGDCSRRPFSSFLHERELQSA